ncbi:hypothetical protein EV127DRAFT_437007 [Xylaria flabelliformis]|nr:hypothetical protein EV127DRAFT_437007 [Xylaria flabelliformis]
MMMPFSLLLEHITQIACASSGNSLTNSCKSTPVFTIATISLLSLGSLPTIEHFRSNCAVLIRRFDATILAAGMKTLPSACIFQFDTDL